jgi:hypothetical protein
MIEHKLDHEPEAYLRLPAPSWGDPRLGVLLIGAVERMQVLEDAIWSVIDQLDPDLAGRWMLERMAQWVGEDSRPTDTAVLRLLVKGRIAANLSSGTIPELISLAQALLGVYLVGFLENTLELKFEVRGNPPGAPPMNVVWQLLDAAAAGAVRVTIIQLPTAGAFAFPDHIDPAPPTTAAMGTGLWSSSYDIA